MRITTISCLVLFAPVARADDWKPAPGPLLTRWAKDVDPGKSLPEYPRPQMVREQWQSLNGLWDFNPVEKPGNWPHKILVPFPVEASLSGYGKMVDGPVWYRRTFTIPKEWNEKRILLHFGAVNWESDVMINGNRVGSHKGGYDAFSFDITEQLKPGDNEIVVRAVNPADKGPQPRGKQVKKPGGIFYTPSTGIWQTVWLEPVGRASIESLTKIELSELRPDGVYFPSVYIKIRGDASGLRLNLKAKGITGTLASGSGDAKDGRWDIPFVGAPKLEQFWTPDSPRLHNYRVELWEEEKLIDSVESYVAFRKIEVGKDKDGITRLFLNGKPYFMAGPLDQGFWPDGLYTAPTDEALKYDIEITKKLGFNCTRKHVKVEPERWYYWCDKLGLLVWQDMPSGDKFIGARDPDIARTPESAKQYEAELKAMIEGLCNHHSVVMWVPFNEGWGQFDTRRIAELTKTFDPTRLVNSASGWTDRGVGDVHDIHVYPGPGSPNPEPNRAAVLGEFGGFGLAVKGHLWNEKTWSYRGVADSADLTRKYERLLRRVYELKQKPGLSAAIYTQLTDVETETNGLLTYDRAVVKVDVDRVAAANRGDFSKVPGVEVLVPTSQEQGIAWRYTFDKPADGWFQPDFDASAWKEGPGGFGTKGTPGAVVRTEWKTADIWIRREFKLPVGPFDGVMLSLHHDEDAEVYLNGVPAAMVPGFVTDYDEVPISAEARKALRKGKNVIAIHCHQTTGGQYIDAGLLRVK